MGARTQGSPTSRTPTNVVTPTPLLPFMAGLSLLNFSQLINDPLLHDPTWPIVPTKLLSNIPKFESNPREDPTNHVRSFRMCCSSNSFTEDSTHLRLFQHTLHGVASKWYVDHPKATHSTFVNLATYFLSYFQLPLHYDIDTELLTSFYQTFATHLSDNVQE